MNDDFPNAIANDIFLADGGVDDFDDLTDEELERIIRRVLPDYVPMILDAAKKLQGSC